MQPLTLSAIQDTENPLRFALAASNVDAPDGSKAVFDPGDGSGFQVADVVDRTAALVHTYQRPGRYVVQLYAGPSGDNMALDVTGQPLEPPALAVAGGIESGQALNAASGRATGITATRSWWTWGDGTSPQLVAVLGGVAQAVHEYAAAGDYTLAVVWPGHEGLSEPVPLDIKVPHLTELDPDTAVVGGDDLVMHVRGTGFTPQSVIVFNGGDERTTYVSATELTTIVKPSTASGPWTVPVTVRNPYAPVSDPRDFTFTEPVAP